MKLKSLSLLSASLLAITTTMAQSVKAPSPVYPIPSAAQMRWHKMELNAFIHFTTNTFTDKEWGYGDESPSVFNPSALDANQWAKTLKETGFKTMILTCKHHDGFCLWPSAYTEHSVKASPWKNGKGDIVREASDAAKKAGLLFGVYLSPWDRNRADYGQPSYVTYYRNQLKELFTKYGPVVEMWFDGANGGDGFYGGAREKRKINGATYYEWPTTLDLVRSMQPEVVFFSDAGPGVRWVGNESGVAGETNWNTISVDTLYAGKAGIEKLLNTGSENGDKWIPAETDVSIRPGWFYHSSEDAKVKTPEQLFKIYLSSVGRGSTLLLNIPPDRRGLFHEKDVASLYGFQAMLKKELGTNLALHAAAKADSYRGRSSVYSASKTTDDTYDTYWATDDGVTTGSVELSLSGIKEIKYILLQEYIPLGQRVKQFDVAVWKNNTWETVAKGTTIGYKRILSIAPVQTDKIRISIKEAKASPLLNNIAVY